MKLVVANIQSHEMIGPQTASVVASTIKIEKAADYADKVRNLFDNKLEIVPGTVRNVSKMETAKAVAFHVRPVTESRPYDDADKMRTVVEANVFADEDDATWQVVEAQGVKRLVKRTDTDISALLSAASKQSTSRIAASYFDANVGTVNQGEFAIFTNPETASVDSGIVTYSDKGEMQILSVKSGALIPCSHQAVVAHSAFDFELEENDSREEVAGLDRKSTQSLVAYFRKLFASQPAFFTKLEAMMRQRAMLA